MNRLILNISICLLLFANALYSQSGQWINLKPTNSPLPRMDLGMAYLGDDQVVIFGGLTRTTKLIVLDDTWIYDLSENTWTEVVTDTRPPARYLHTMCRLGDGKALIFGGNLENDTYAGDTWVFDSNTMTWEEINSDKNPRYRDRAEMAYVGDNKALLYGGWPGPIEYYKDSWIYNASNNTWDSVNTASPWTERERAQMCEIDDQKIFLFGGHYLGSLNDNWIFNGRTQRWEVILPKPNNYRRDSGDMAYLTENKVLLYGGDTSSDTTNPDASERADDTWIFDFEQKIWTKLILSKKPYRRRYHSLANIGDGKVLMFGANYGLESGKETWLFEYDPANVIDIDNDETVQVFKLNSYQTRIIIRFSEMCIDRLKINLFDIKGVLLKSIYNDIPQANKLEIEFNNQDLQSGIFFLRFSTNQFLYNEKLLIVR